MRKLLVMLFVATTAFTGVARGQFCPGAAPYVFTDVPANDSFCSNITWMAATGVTTGCQVIDATNRLYCPDDLVTRKQMSAFMFRLDRAIMPSTCSVGQTIKWSGLDWGCANDDQGGGAGTVTSVLAGTGLQASPNPIVGAGSINLAPGYQLPQLCANGLVPKSNGAGGWTCGTDNAGTGTVTSVTAGTGLTGGTITGTGTLAVDTTAIQTRVTGTCAVGNYVRAIAADGTVACGVDSGGSADAFVQGGNAFGAAAVLGTNDNQPLELRVNNSRLMRYEPNSISPNVIGGSPANNVRAGVRGATIAGGGVPLGDTDPDFTYEAPNRVTDVYGTVGGGYANRAGDDDNFGTVIDASFATVGGGVSNIASGAQSTVSGGGSNTAGSTRSTVGGGNGNTASGPFSTVPGGRSNLASGFDSVVGGGWQNTAAGVHSTVGGGYNNFASGQPSTIGGGMGNQASATFSTIGGGHDNTASGSYSTVPGGTLNIAQGSHSFAAGTRARALHDNTFVWGGSTTIDVNSQANGEFLVYAPTAVRLFAGAPGSGGCTLTSGAGWACTSDRTLKSDVVAVDQGAILEQVMALPIAKWSLSSQPGVRHVGPMAQDFHKAFGLGEDDTTITTVDVQGVALAAIQGLNAKLEAKVAAKDAEISTLKREMADHRATHQKELADLRLAVEVLMARTSTEGRVAQTR